MRILDCTLRDGANVVGRGFSAELTLLMLKGLTAHGIGVIEIGNAMGLNVPDSPAPLSDREYMALAQPFADQAEIGLFLGWRNAAPEGIDAVAESGLSFLRVGADAGDGAKTREAVRRVKAAGLTARYALMKAYLSPSDALADEAAALEQFGVDEIIVMDSAGAMRPEGVAEAVAAIKQRVAVPVGFHGHDNLGLATANALAAVGAGADSLDCCLTGMARSAGNMPTELAAALFPEAARGIDLFGLLHFIDAELSPAMSAPGYRAPIPPRDLVCGLAGAHSHFLPRFEKIASDEGVDLFKLILAVSVIDRKAPSEDLIRRTARGMERACPTTSAK